MPPDIVCYALRHVLLRRVFTRYATRAIAALRYIRLLDTTLRLEMLDCHYFHRDVAAVACYRRVFFFFYDAPCRYADALRH